MEKQLSSSSSQAQQPEQKKLKLEDEIPRPSRTKGFKLPHGGIGILASFYDEQPIFDAPVLTEDEAVNVLLELAIASGSNPSDESRRRDDLDDGNNETIDLGDGNVMATLKELEDSTEGLLILASCIPPGPDIDMTDEDRLERLGEFLESVGESRDLISQWTITWSKSKGKLPYFTTETGEKLRTKFDVSNYLNLGAVSMKMAEMIDYMDERHLRFVPSQWRVEERKKPDGRRSGFSFSFVLTGKTFYSRNRIAEFIETYKYKPIKRSAVRKPAVKTASSQAEKVASKKKKRSCKVGDPVVVDYEGTVYDALIVSTPPSLPEYDSEDDERLVSVYYIQEECFEHGVLESRILRERTMTERDANAMEEIEKSNLVAYGDDSEEDDEDSIVNGSRKPSTALKKTKEEKKLAKALKKAEKEKKKLKKLKQAVEKDEEKGAKKDKVRIPRTRPGRKKKEKNGSVPTPQDPTGLTPEENAESYLKLVRDRIEQSMPRLFMSFISIMSAFNRGKVRIEEVIDFIIDAFGEDDTDLVLKFNSFLPDELKITPAHIRRRIVLLAAQAPSEEPVVVGTAPDQVAALEVAPASAAAASPMITYDMYLSMVSFRFLGNPAGMERFRDIMAQFQVDHDVSRLVKEATELFKGFPELAEGLNAFLPDDHKIALSTA